MKQRTLITILVTLLFFAVGAGSVSLRQEGEKEGRQAGEEKPLTNEEGYVKKEVLFISWGSKEDEVGFKAETLGERILETVRYGAEALEVDSEGNLYIHDSVNTRVLKYRAAKEGYYFECALPLQQNQFYGRCQYLEYGYVVITDGYGFEAFKMKEVARISWRIVDKKTNEVVAILNLADIDNENTYYSWVIGNDKQGNIYVLVDTTWIGMLGPSEWKLEVHKYTPSGDFITTIRLESDENAITFTDRREGQRKRIAVDAEGNIYQLLAKEDGVHVIKWEVSN